jgi:hypothetical protein
MTRRWMALLLCPAAACLAEAPADGVDEIDTEEDAVSGGAVVPNNDAPFGFAIKMLHPLSGVEQCSGVKIGTKRFLTAAHCTETLSSGQTIFISNKINPLPDDGAAARWTEVKIDQLFVHPSYTADPDTSGSFSSEHSYDIAVFDILETTSSIPTASIHRGHIADGTEITAVGYGANTQITANAGKKQFATFSTTRSGASDARYAHQLLALERGTGREGLDGGDSGGPAFASDGGTLKVAGINQNGTAKGRPASQDPLASGMARVANVQRWIDAPHNKSLVFSGIGFIHNIGMELCANVASTASGTPVELRECEGYDPAIHAALWEILPVSGTNAFQIKSRKANRCWDLSDVNVVLASCNSSLSTQRWATTVNGDDGMGHFVINQSNPAAGILGKVTGSVPPFNLRVGSSSLGVLRKWMFYR